MTVSRDRSRKFYKYEMVGTKELAESLFRIGDWIRANGITAPGRYQAARHMLQRIAPQLKDGETVAVGAGESGVQAARRMVDLLHQ